MAENKTSSPNDNSKDTVLHQTLRSFEGFLQTITAGALSCTKDAETLHLLQADGSALSSQFQKLTAFTEQHFVNLNVAQKEELDTFLRVQDGIQIGNAGGQTAQRAFAAGWFKKFLKWALHWFKEIKKILREIIAMILNALGLRFPPWLETIFLLLDQFYDAFVALLADVFGLDVAKFSADASRLEVQFANELYAVDRLRNLRNINLASDED